MLTPFEYRNGALFAEDCGLDEIAHRVGTPAYVYSATAILERFRAYDSSFGNTDHQVCYAVKANSNLSLLRLLAEAGAGFDIVSGGELFRVIKAGGDPTKIVFSGVGKTANEVDAALAAGIYVFNCESEPELALVDALAHRRGLKPRIAMRVNPDVDAATHAYISTGKLAHKFGIDIADAPAVYHRARQFKNLSIDGVSCHIGSQIMNPDRVMDAVDRVLALIDSLNAQGFEIRHGDFGGGLGIAYESNATTPDIASFVQQLTARVGTRKLKIMIEPGRSIVAEAGVLLTQVLYRKSTGGKEFVIVDAAMNDLIRPALYSAHHEIAPVRDRGLPAIRADIVGPVCESGDFLAKDRELAESFPGDLLAIKSAGAYGFVQASNYNSRPRAAEVLVEGTSWKFIRQRETFDDLIRGE